MAETVRDVVKRYRRQMLGGRYEPDFFELVRCIEAASGERNVGKSAARRSEPVRFGQMPHLNFAESGLAEITDRPKPDVIVNFLGLWGPQGPMPLELTEFVYQRMHNHGDNTLRRFADILHQRFIGLYYRAWKANEQAALFDKPDGGLVAGVSSALAGETCRGSRLDRFASARWSGLFGNSAKSRDGLTTLLVSALGMPVRVRDGLESVRVIPPESRCRLGRRGVAELGGDAELGSRYRTCTHRFAVEIGPLTFREAAKLLPGSRRYRRLVDLVHAYLDRPFDWSLNLTVVGDTIPAPSLDGDRQLGRSTWLGRATGGEQRLVVDVSRLEEHAKRRSRQGIS